MPTPAEALMRFFGVLDEIEIPYSVGGSVASSTHGTPRMTMDVDLVADLKPDQIDELVRLLGGEFYADAEMIREALSVRRSFNIIHYSTAYKFDVFPLGTDAYSHEEFSRRAFTLVRALGGEPIECAVATAEDTILRKLQWYRLGGETSERQWNDVRSIVNARKHSLDRDYLQRWAAELKIDYLLGKLLAE